MPKILLIDDDERLAEHLHAYFQRFDLDLISANHPQAGLDLLASGQHDIDLIILDIMLPDQDGFEVCRTIRKSSEIPILMLTARGEVMDRVIGLEIGADDYLAKPFEPRELVARIQNILRRVSKTTPQETEQLLCFKDLEIDLALRQVKVAGMQISLTTMEYQFLILLAQAAGKSFSRDEILNQLKGIDADIFTRSVDILVSRLRQKLKPTEYIKTVWGSGYSFIGPRS